MGCDIHGYIDYLPEWMRDEKNYHEYIQFSYLPRNYVMFGYLAGVRCDDVKHIEPKGYPMDSDIYNYWLYVNTKYEGDSGQCSKENADKWVAIGYSVEHPLNTEHYRRVSCPDWHSASWLNAEELEKVFENYQSDTQYLRGDDKKTPVEYAAILAILKSLPNSRFVFWFDN